jgi:polysaccharide deacetylase 2 family uncharacterized protein YibQ
LPKSTRNNGRKRSRRNGKGNGTALRAFVYGLSFVAVLVLGLYGLYHLKKNIPPQADKITTESMSALVKDADGIISGAFFDLGISSEDVEAQKTYKRSSDGVKWEFREIVVNTPEKVSDREIKTVFKKSFTDRKPYELTFKSSGDKLLAYLKSDGLKTHNITFERPGKAPPQKVAEGKKEKESEAAGVGEPAGDAGKTEEAPRKDEQSDAGGFEPKVAIIVDDIGMSRAPVDELLKLPAPVTLSVLPGLPYSSYAAEAANKKGWEVMLHLPMEPMESSGYMGPDAGEDTLLVGQPKEAIIAKLNKNLSSVPYIKGVNNHMGSKFMENQELVEVVLEEIKRRGLFFVDSFASAGSLGYKTALSLGMKTGKRDVFLDNSKDPEYVKSQIEKLIQSARKNGYAIGICHPYPVTVKVLTEMEPEISEQVELVPVSSVLTRGREISER